MNFCDKCEEWYAGRWCPTCHPPKKKKNEHTTFCERCYSIASAKRVEYGRLPYLISDCCGHWRREVQIMGVRHITVMTPATGRTPAEYHGKTHLIETGQKITQCGKKREDLKPTAMYSERYSYSYKHANDLQTEVCEACTQHMVSALKREKKWGWA